MPIATDFEIQSGGNIRHVANTNTYTVLELHRWLQDLADDSAFSSDDTMDITFPNPSSRATDRIITLLNGYNIDDTAAQYLYGGSIRQGTGGSEVLYSGLQVLGSVNSPTTLQVIQNNALLTAYWGTGLNNSGSTLLRILVKSRTAGADIDGQRIRVQARTFGDTYSSFDVILGDGESVAAISTVADPQNNTAVGTVGAYGVTNTEGFQLIDLGDGSADQPYYAQWDYNSEGSLKATYEYAKYIQRTGSAETIHGINGALFRGITHSYTYNTETGTAFVEDDIITWGSGATAGTGLLLADDTVGNEAHIQLLTGVAPTASTVITNEATTGTHTVVTITPRVVPSVFLGSYTGTLIGAFGVGIVPSQLTASDSVQDLDGDTNTPPVTVNFGFTGLIANSELRIYRTSDSFEIDGTESSGTTFTYNYQYSSDIGVYVIIFHLSYRPIRLTGLTLTNANQSIPIQQVFDRVYDNP